MNQLNSARVAGFAICACLALWIDGCGGTTGGNPTVELQLASYSANFRLWDWMVPNALAAVNDAKICVRRLRFKPEESSTADNLDFQPGEVRLTNSSSSTLGEVTLAAGNYRRIEFDLAKNGSGCTSGFSAQVVNSNGTFTTDDSITIKFAGSFTANEGKQVLSLNARQIIEALNSVTASSGNTGTLKSVLEGASALGTY